MTAGSDITAPTTAGHRILLVEDSPTQALRLQMTLEGQGWSVTVCGDAESALDHLGREMPDLALVDYHLPRMNGDEFVRRVRLDLRTRGLSVLMLTDSHAADRERQGYDSGADAYVPKSADIDILLSRVAALLRKTTVGAAGGTVPGLAPVAMRRSRLLVVDDSPTYLFFITAQLQEDGHEVVGVSGGREALDRIEREKFDCIVVDLVMPEMSGTELCQHLDRMRRQHDRLFQIIILTSRDNKEDMMRGLEAGADDFVGKASESEILKARIRALLRRKFLHEENLRITSEFRDKELELERTRDERRIAQERAAMAEALERSHAELEEAYRELQDTQSQLVQAAKMASLGALVAGIAHELNNPLAFVGNHLGTIARCLENITPEIQGHLSEKGGRDLEKMRQRLAATRLGIDRVEDLVVKLRTFSRLDEAEVKEVEIEDSLESVLTLLQHKLSERIVVERKYAGPKRITCQPGPLNQVLMNIVGNAIDAIDGAGTITLETARNGPMFRLSVRDTGHGIPAAIRDRICEPFFTTKPVGSGTGLGLSISYSIIQRHRGRLEFHSEEGQGTEVVIEIPLDGASADAPAPSGPAQAAHTAPGQAAHAAPGSA
ncbi:response regulator [Nitrospirillum pindoramense]|uniref:histidine kinase n=1 Tax=Nitrospirillum amazonense TaxID=28077 RepID=A0A560GVF6_9PROT|nr:response regulator [Nitrospirillum amazonense]TWB37579.1 two-component system NtrC family sensor kinase [Nitrospirillum amazonense]